MKNIDYIEQCIKVVINNTIKNGTVKYSTGEHCLLFILLPNNIELKSLGDDLFSCFSIIRNNNPDITFLCKGSKRNVYPSNMCRQMASGLIAYEYSFFKPATEDCLVNIFDFDDDDVSTTPDEQKMNHREWLKSLRSLS